MWSGREALLLELLMDQMQNCRLCPMQTLVSPSAEQLGPGRRDARQGVAGPPAGRLAGSHLEIYGAALERESLPEMYQPPYLLGVGPPDEPEQLLLQPRCRRRWQDIYGPLSWPKSPSGPLADSYLAGRERPRPPWSLGSNNA